MRFWSIWSMPSYSLAERLRRTRDWAAWQIAGMLPKRVRYVTTIGEIAKVTTMKKNGHKAVPDFTMNDILQDLDAPKSMT